MVETQLNVENLKLMGYLQRRSGATATRTATVAPATGAVEEPRD